MKKQAIIISIAFLTLFAACAREAKQEEQKTQAANPQASTSVKPVRVSAENTDAAEPTVAPAPDGTAYVAWVEHRAGKESDVMLAHLDSEGRTLSTSPVRVNPTAGEATAWRGDPPTVAVSKDGTVHVGWTARVEAALHASDIYLSTSRDGGRSFDPPVKVNDDGKKVTHGMHSLAVGPDNRVYVVWLDERNVVKPVAADQKGMKMDHMEANREVFFASSFDGGRTFSQNQRLAKEACPCCKTAVAVGENGRIYASWRQVLPGEFRHIALASSEDQGKTFSQPVIVSDDRWMTASCPVSGPALSAAPDGRLRVVWYTEGDRGEPGLYWAESLDQGKTFSESKPFAKGQARGLPLLVGNGRSVATIVWESTEGGAPRVMTAPLTGDNNPATITPLTATGELPSATISGEQLFVSYIAKVNDQRSIWVVRTKPTT